MFFGGGQNIFDNRQRQMNINQQRFRQQQRQEAQQQQGGAHAHTHGQPVRNNRVVLMQLMPLIIILLFSIIPYFLNTVKYLL